MCMFNNDDQMHLLSAELMPVFFHRSLNYLTLYCFK